MDIRFKYPILKRRSRFGFSGLLDDLTGLVAAYSTRRLTGASWGTVDGIFDPIVRIRRNSDNDEQTFSYDEDNELSKTDVSTFLSGANGYFTKWYDQSGNGYHLTQSTVSRQPLYNASGQNNRPVLECESSGDWMTNTAFVDFADEATIYCAYRFGDAGFNPSYSAINVCDDADVSSGLAMYWTGGNVYAQSYSGGGTNNVVFARSKAQPMFLHTLTYKSDTFLKSYLNGASQGTPVSNPGALDNTLDKFVIMNLEAEAGNTALVGKMAETIIFSIEHSDSIRNMLEANIIAYWGL